MDTIEPTDIQELLLYFAKNLYRADSKCQDVMAKCQSLVTLDYNHVVISNTCGELSSHYPSQLIILEYERSTSNVNNSCLRPATEPLRTTSTIYESVNDVNKLRDLFTKARSARCRARFPLPVILYRGKHICRSATLSGGPEIYGRSGLDYLFSGNENAAEDEMPDEMGGLPQTQSDWQLFDRVRNQDIRLLKKLNVGTIVDFMVENKKVKFGVNVTSSEKVDKENRYSDFTIISLPYPGCEFFKEFSDNNYEAKGLKFDWNQAHVDASIGVPDDPISSQLRIEWEQYKVWDLIKLTQNYMKLLLRYLQENSTGLLIHCISGWDRTPLFISLLRLSLWADGAVHQSLTAYQILYFTIAYDWMLFGHNLEDRVGKGENIFYFCFYFLKHLWGDEYSVAPRSKSKQRNDAAQRNDLVHRIDMDLHLEGVLLDSEGPNSSRGSNISLNSTCSSVGSRSQDNPPLFFHNTLDTFEEQANGNINTLYMAQQWPQYLQTQFVESSPANATSHCATSSQSPGPSRSPHTSRTSPVPVPVSSRPRQRNDSNSSLGMESWQDVSRTGSLRGSTSTFDSNASNSGNSQESLRSEEPVSADSSTTVINDCFVYNTGASEATRRERLKSVRTLFSNAYSSTIGLKYNTGPELGLGSLLENFAEKVGIISPQRTLV